MPTVSQFNWTQKDAVKFERAMEAFRAVQMHYFRQYIQMPAVCPGSEQRWLQAGGRIVNRKGEIKLDGSKLTNIGGVTSECELVEHMYGMVDHLFYAHGWSREQVADVIEWYENTRSNAAIVRNFAHYAVN